MARTDLPADLSDLSDLDALVPHRGRMSWLERVLEADDEHVVAEAVVQPQRLFVRDGRLSAWAGIEYMAQAVAAWAGRRAQLRGSRVEVGLLLGTRRYEVLRQHFDVGQRLRIEARCELMGDNGLGMFACRIEVDGQTAATANLSVFEPKDGAAFLQSKEGTA